MIINSNEGDVVIYEVANTKAQLLNKIDERIRKYNWTSFLSADNIDYKEFYYESDRIKIKRKPTALTTFGEIDLFIEDNANGKVNMKFKIIPINKLFPIGRLLLIAFGILLTIFALIINRSTNSLIIIILGWILVSLFIFFQLKFERYMLKRYTLLIVKNLS